MKEQYGVTWEVERAFHAVPSMEHLHLHVVSMDLVSDRLKHKKHYLSFQPNVGFAVRLNEVENLVKQGKKSLPKSEQAYEQLLKGALVGHHTGQVYRFFPELKAHLESYWRDNTLAAGHTASENAAATNVKDGSGTGSPPARPPQRRKIELSDAQTKADTSNQKSPDSSMVKSHPCRPGESDSRSMLLCTILYFTIPKCSLRTRSIQRVRDKSE